MLCLSFYLCFFGVLGQAEYLNGLRIVETLGLSGTGFGCSSFKNPIVFIQLYRHSEVFLQGFPKDIYVLIGVNIMCPLPT